MKIISSAQMKEIDHIAQAHYGIPSLILMENAGLRAADIALKMLKTKNKPRVLVFSGRGNNGGDGLVAARHLLNHGAEILVYLISPKGKLSQDANLNLNILLKMRQDVKIISDVFKPQAKSSGADLIIDAIFGIGYKGTVKEPFYSVIKFINAAVCPVLALDVPSGLDADTGNINNIAVHATKTVTFGYAKKGLFLRKGRKYCGKVEIADISLPSNIGH